jgi:hypothetical protein
VFLDIERGAGNLLSVVVSVGIVAPLAVHSRARSPVHATLFRARVPACARAIFQLANKCRQLETPRSARASVTAPSRVGARRARAAGRCSSSSPPRPR